VRSADNPSCKHCGFHHPGASTPSCYYADKSEEDKARRREQAARQRADPEGYKAEKKANIARSREADRPSSGGSGRGSGGGRGSAPGRGGGRGPNKKGNNVHFGGRGSGNA
jgi:hypothetical protein